MSASKLVLEDGTILTQCDQCRTMWQERNDRGVEGGPDCENDKFCKYDPGSATKLFSHNIDAARIYQHVRHQVLLYFNGEYNKELDINHQAVWMMIDHYPSKLSDPFAVFELIVSTYHHFLQEQNDDDSE